jgi:hypothetical protein
MSHVSTSRLTLGRFAPAVLLLVVGLTGGCAKVVATAGSSGGSHGGPGTGGAGGSSRGGTGAGGMGVTPDSGALADGAACQERQFTFKRKIPNVFVLVDGSGSMFDVTTALPNGRWGALRSALLPVIMGLQDQVNFGLGIFSGVIATNECPIFQTVPIAASNYDNILAQYPAGRLRPQSVALETPLSESLPMIPPFFDSAPKTGSSYVLFATDGEPDFCDNGNAVCPVDAGIAGILKLFTQGITTYVMGLSSDINAGTCPGVLQGYANAGANQDIANPCPGHGIYDECNGVAPWKAIATQTGRTTGQALVDYKATAGAAKVFAPNVSDQQSLTDTLASLFSGVKSCSFDLDALGADPIHVDTAQLDKAQVLIENVVVPLDSTNGWKINCVPLGDPACRSTQVELTGSSCTTWRMPNTENIEFKFPCEVIVPG